MSSYIAEQNARPAFDKVMQDIADYVMNYEVHSQEAFETARYCLMDTLGCGLLALRYPECTKLLGNLVPGMSIKQGARVPGTSFELDPVQAAFNIGTMVRWLDYNDTWLAAEWGHPSDNLGAILAVADYMSRRDDAARHVFSMQGVLIAMIKAHEIQGCLALENSFNRVGLDHVLLVKIASVAVATQMLGGNREQILNALSLAFVDGQSLRTYRHAPNTGSRKSWAAGDATSRAVRLGLMAMVGEMGYPSAISAAKWGFSDVLFKGKSLAFQRDYGSYVMENILFKIAFPAEFHAQTAVECAIALHPKVKGSLENIERIEVETQESGVRIISKEGPLHNPADRDHCLQYMIAIGLLKGHLTADDYEDNVARMPEVDALRRLMHVRENADFSRDYLDPEKRSIANAVQIFFKDGTKTERVQVDYPIGHRKRRQEGIPILIEKFDRNLQTRFSREKSKRILNLCLDSKALAALPVSKFMDLLIG